MLIMVLLSFLVILSSHQIDSKEHFNLNNLYSCSISEESLNQKSVTICLNACNATNLTVIAAFNVDGTIRYIRNEEIPVPTEHREDLLWLELSINTSENITNNTVKSYNFTVTSYADKLTSTSHFLHWVIRDQSKVNKPFFVINSTEQCQRTTTIISTKHQYTFMDASQIVIRKIITACSANVWGGAVSVVLFVIVFVVVGASLCKRRIRAREVNGGANIQSMDAVADSRDGFREALTRREIINRDFQPYVDASSAPATKITQTLSPFPVNHCNVNRLYPESEPEQEYENIKNLYPVGSDGYVIMNSWEVTRNLYANEIGNSHI